MDFRKHNAITQRIHLVRFEIVPEKSNQPKKLIFHILGNSQRVYKVFFPKEQMMKCSCPDHCVRKVNCKHILFVTTKILNIEPEEWISITDIDNVAKDVAEFLPHLTDIQVSETVARKYAQLIAGETQDTGDDTKTEVRNTECCVCLSDLDLEEKNDILVCSTCKNGIHVLCWNKWSSINGARSCVYCRSLIQHNRASGMEKDKWGIKILI